MGRDTMWKFEPPLAVHNDWFEMWNASDNQGGGATWTTASTLTGNLSTEQNTPAPIVDVSRGVVFYSLGLIIPIGLICNTISIFVFMSKPLRMRAASWYLAALAMSDDVSLLTFLIDYWLKDLRAGLPIIKSSVGLCISITYFSHASRLLSAWLVTSFTIERFIGVVFPLQRAALSSTTHARKLILSEVVACLLATSFCLFTIGIADTTYGKECDVLPDRYTLYLVFNMVFLVFGSIVIPILIICTLNMFILYKVYQRKVYFTPKNMRFSGAIRRAAQKASRDFNIASLLLVVSTTFVILNAPYCICWFLLYSKQSNIGITSDYDIWHLFAGKYFASVPYYLNYSINFALYSLCARAFRLAVVRMFTCRRCGFLRGDDMFTDTRVTVLDRLCLEQRCGRGNGRGPTQPPAAQQAETGDGQAPTPEKPVNGTTLRIGGSGRRAGGGGGPAGGSSRSSDTATRSQGSGEHPKASDATVRSHSSERRSGSDVAAVTRSRSSDHVDQSRVASH